MFRDFHFLLIKLHGARRFPCLKCKNYFTQHIALGDDRLIVPLRIALRAFKPFARALFVRKDKFEIDDFHIAQRVYLTVHVVDILIVEEPHEIVSPHAFPVTLRDPRLDSKKLYAYLEDHGVQCKTNFGSLPTQHRAFAWMGHQLGEFPASEYIGENGLHFGVHRYLSDADIDFAAETLRCYFRTQI